MGWKNHQKMVEKVLPKGGETGLHSANLSYLVFYANARPSKLAKLGVYLHDRIISLSLSEKHESAAMYLSILDTLATECSAHLSLFSHKVIATIEQLLSIPTSPLSNKQQATILFSRFLTAPMHGRLTLLESMHASNLISLLDSYCNFASSSLEDASDRASTRRMGVQGIFVVIASLDLRAVGNRAAIDKLVPHLLINLSSDATTAVPPPQVGSVGAVALAVLESMCSRADPSTVAWLATPVLESLDRSDEWPSGALPSLVLSSMAMLLPAPCRPLLISAVLEYMLPRALRDRTSAAAPRVFQTLGKLVTTAKVPLGPTALQLVSISVEYILDPAASEAAKSAASSLLDELVGTGSLVAIKHAAVSDLLERVNGLLDASVGEGAQEALEAKCGAILDLCAKLARSDLVGSGAEAREASALSLVLPPVVVNPLFELLESKLPMLRTRALDILYELLRSLSPAAATGDVGSAAELRLRSISLFQEQHGRELARRVSVILSGDSLSPAQAVAILKISILLARTASLTDTVESELASSLTAFSVAQLRLADAGPKAAAGRRAVFALSVAYLGAVAEHFSCAPLASLLAEVRQGAPPSLFMPGGVELKSTASIGKISRLGSFRHLEKKAIKKAEKAGEAASPTTPAVVEPPTIAWDKVYDALATLPGVEREAISRQSFDQPDAQLTAPRRGSQTPHIDTAAGRGFPSAALASPVFSASLLQKAAEGVAPTQSNEFETVDEILAFVAPREADDEDADDE